MTRQKRKFSSNFKAKVAIEALKERETIQQLAARYELHPNQISQWKKQFIEGASDAFSSGTSNESKQLKEERDRLFKKVGQLQVENDFLKKSLGED